MTSEQSQRRSRCPECGAEATEESLVDHKLSALGYKHDDQMFECSECGHSYPHGVPVGEFDGDAEDLWCDVCDLGYMRVHRIKQMDGNVGLHLKCPHHYEFDCPECNEEIAADGVRRTVAGRMCPHCERHLERDDVPFCFYFTQTRRESGERDISLIGYPDITGELNPEEPYGFPDDPDDSGEENAGVW